MKLKQNKIIYFLLLPMFLLTACQDEDLIKDGYPTNPNAVTFSATAQPASQSETRGGGLPVYEPLVLKGEDSKPLYLHTYETEKIGYEPGVDRRQTRGNQVVTGDALKKFHKNFKVLARKYDDGKNYFGWEDTQCADDYNVWFTSTTKYWPGQEKLSFNAVSPAEEFGRLEGFDINGSGAMKFSYTAVKSTNDNDAELQPDLLLASSACNKSNSESGRAPLKFTHALSAVKFAIRDVLGGEVVNIKIAGVHSKGDCEFWSNDEQTVFEYKWTNQSDIETYSQNFGYEFDDPYVKAPETITDILLQNKMPEKTFMMIPQEIPDDAEIIVTLKFNGIEGEKVLRGKIKDNLVHEWKAGHEYVYTISTSKENWTYKFGVGGNHQGDKSSGAHGIVNGDYIYVFSPAARYKDGNDVKYYHDIWGNQATMNVISYRYRTNNPDVMEEVPWTASNTGTQQFQYYGNKEYSVSDKDLTAEKWIPSRDALHGNGSYAADGEQVTLEFEPHHQLTDWPGDAVLQSNKAYSGYSENKPFDLSTVGGHRGKTTANCYVIDRQGWYSFPLVYGNGYKDGNENTDAYTYTKSINNTLKTFVNHSGGISSPDITGVSSVKILWSDVYNAITDVDLSSDKKSVVFHANAENMQQGNVVIAACNSSGQIVWSWHIWITEHWLDKDGYCNAFKSGSRAFDTSKSGWRDYGDVKIDNKYVSGDYNFYISPYNIGWCDPKNVDYLRRRGTMSFVQYKPDGVTPTGNTAELPILQEGIRVEFKEGNNVYYQWGRKDPSIGFINHSSTKKRNFVSETDFKFVAGHQTLSTAVMNPMTFCYNGDSYGQGKYGNWTDQNFNASYVNLWDNNMDDYDGASASKFKLIKTVYDPCPPGYSLPSAYVYRFVGQTAAGSFFDDSSVQNKDTWNFNGRVFKDDPYTLEACAIDVNADKSNMTTQNTIWLTATGAKWDRPYLYGSGESAVNAGGNYNPQDVFLWSGSSGLGGSYNTVSNRWYDTFNGFSLALGLDLLDNGGLDTGIDKKPKKRVIRRSADGTLDKFVICSYFPARKTLARPVRAVREQ